MRFRGWRFLKGFLKRNSSTILSLVAVAGVVGTTVLAIKAKSKADEVLEEEKEIKGMELTQAEKVRATAPYYIPVIALCAGTSACILGANAVSRKQIGFLAAAYGLLEQSLINCQKKLGKEEVIAIEDETVTEEIKHDKVEAEYDDPEAILFYEPCSKTYFTARPEYVKDAWINLNRRLAKRSYVGFNEFLDDLDIQDCVDKNSEIYCEIIGWDEAVMTQEWERRWIDVSWTKTILDDGLEVHPMHYYPSPTVDETLYPQCRGYFDKDFVPEYALA